MNKQTRTPVVEIRLKLVPRSEQANDWRTIAQITALIKNPGIIVVTKMKLECLMRMAIGSELAFGPKDAPLLTFRELTETKYDVNTTCHYQYVSLFRRQIMALAPLHHWKLINETTARLR